SRLLLPAAAVAAGVSRAGGAAVRCAAARGSPLPAAVAAAAVYDDGFVAEGFADVLRRLDVVNAEVDLRRIRQDTLAIFPAPFQLANVLVRELQAQSESPPDIQHIRNAVHAANGSRFVYHDMDVVFLTQPSLHHFLDTGVELETKQWRTRPRVLRPLDQINRHPCFWVSEL